MILSIQPDENNRISTHVYSFISDLMEFFPFILVFKSNVLDHVLDHIIFVDTSNARKNFDLIIRGRFLVKNFTIAKFYGNYPETMENIFATLLCN